MQWTALFLRPGAGMLLDHSVMIFVEILPVFLDIHSAVGQGVHGLFVQEGQAIVLQDLYLLGFLSFAFLQKLEGTSCVKFLSDSFIVHLIFRNCSPPPQL